MISLELVFFLLAVSTVLRVVADRIKLPYPALLVTGGLLLALIPGLPRITIDPDLLFVVFVPPLLYWGARSFPLRDLRRQFAPIVRLAVVMVLVSMVAVAWVAHAIDPAFTWGAAFTLGAIVSPPDAVAVLSTMAVLGLPGPVEALLEGEGLFNDATALVAYRMAVAAVVTGLFSPSHAAVQFLIEGVGGVVIGLAVGFVVLQAHRVVRSVPVAENTVSLLTPFAAYLTADLAGTSGVLAVIAAAMYVGRGAVFVMRPATRLQNDATWTVVNFLLESLVFILIGLELPVIMQGLANYPLGTLVRETAIVTLSVVGVRLLWILPSTYIFRGIGRWLRHSVEPFPPFRWILFIGWAGVRGADSLVIALSLPLATAAGAPFPARNQIQFITFAVIFATLVIQGSTLRPLASLLGLHDDGEGEDEEAHARLTAVEAALRALADPKLTKTSYPEVVRYVQQRYRQRARRWAAREQEQFKGRAHDPDHAHMVGAPSHEAGELDEKRIQEYRRVRSQAIEAERRAVVKMRDDNVIGDDVMRAIQRDLDLETMLLDAREPVDEPPGEVPAVLDPGGGSRESPPDIKSPGG
jgi:CPA1 family monovalent cation:H+ antiporter